jgi:sigma-B regulation protein RsbU (phosphoserine phosphatase)
MSAGRPLTIGVEGGARPGPAGRARSRRLSIVDFLTDGSLAALALALSRLTGAEISLRDRRGATVERCDGDPPWRVVPGPDGDEAAAYAALLEGTRRGDAVMVDSVRLLVPIHVRSEPVGALFVRDADEGRRSRLAPLLRTVAATVSERCSEVSELRRRNEELSILFALTSELVTVRDVDAALRLALRAAFDAVGAGAGVIRLAAEDESERERLVAAGLTDASLLELGAASGDSAGGSAPAGPEALDLGAVRANGGPLGRVLEREGWGRVVRCSLSYNNRAAGEMLLLCGRAEDGDGEGTARSFALLRNIAEQAAGAVASHRLEARARRDRQIRRQVRLAGQVQQRLLPRDTQRSGRLDIAARYLPSTELGGDFFDIVPLERTTAITVADVVGKGVPAALLMASVRATIRALAPRLRRKDDIEEIARRVNITLADDTRSNEFATAFLARIDRETLEVIYCNAGHDPPFVVRCDADGVPKGGGVEFLREGGPLLGIDPGYAYEAGRTTLATNDVLIAVTDGVTDAMNFQQEKFSRRRLLESVDDLLRHDPGASARQIVDRVVWDVRRFAGLNPELDDLTILAVRALPSGPG